MLKYNSRKIQVSRAKHYFVISSVQRYYSFEHFKDIMNYRVIEVITKLNHGDMAAQDRSLDLKSFELLYLLCFPDFFLSFLRSTLCALTPALFAMQHKIQRSQYTFHDTVIKIWQLRPNFAMFMWNRTSENDSCTKKGICYWGR